MLSPPPGLSQSATSFIASCCQGIHQTPLSRLIRSRRRQALLRAALVRNRNPLLLWSEVDLTRRRRYPGRRRQAATITRISAAFSVSVMDLERLSWLPDASPLEDKSPNRATTDASEPPLGTDPETSRVIALFTMSVSVAAISRSDRKAHHG